MNDSEAYEVAADDLDVALRESHIGARESSDGASSPCPVGEGTAGASATIVGRLADYADATRGILLPGALAVAVAYVSWLVGNQVRVLGPAVTAMILGSVTTTLARLPHHQQEWSARVGGRVLRLSIVALGGTVDVAYVLRAAGDSLIVMLGTLSIGLVVMWYVGRALGIERRVRALLAAGTSICGVSAVAAVAPAVEAEATQMTYAVAVILVFNIAAVIVFPLVGHLLGFSPHMFGIWAGTAINDTSSVLAAGYAFGSGAVAYAVVVKLARTVMILPVTALMAAVARRDPSLGGDHGAQGRPSAAAVLKRAVPWFIVGFLAMVLASSSHIWSSAAGHSVFGRISTYGVVLSLAAIGLSTDLRALAASDRKGFALGAVGWVTLALSSLALQALASAVHP